MTKALSIFDFSLVRSVHSLISTFRKRGGLWRRCVRPCSVLRRNERRELALNLRKLRKMSNLRGLRHISQVSQVPRVVHVYHFFAEGSPTKIDYRKKGTLILCSLLEDLVSLSTFGLHFSVNFHTRGLPFDILKLGQLGLVVLQAFGAPQMALGVFDGEAFESMVFGVFSIGCGAWCSNCKHIDHDPKIYAIDHS